ncbi:MAG: hypothetical protein C0631_11470 [Sedimenticola sp.]|nr:MAG: hypothetical protein C0631_11470 [Sedimenticola sp.]
MHKKNISILSKVACKKLAIFAMFLVSGCVSMPHYQAMDRDDQYNSGAASAVNYQIDPSLNEQVIDCVVIMPLEITDSASNTITFSQHAQQSSGSEADYGKILDEDIYDLLIDANDKRQMLRSMLYAFMAPHSSRDIELRKVDQAIVASGEDKTPASIAGQLACDWVMQGEITKFSVNNFGIYSAISIAADLQILRASDGGVVWRGSHEATTHEGSLPLTPIDFAVAAVKASISINPEQVERVSSDLARRLVRTMPLDSNNDFVVAQEREQLLRVISQGLNLREGPGTRFAVSDVLNNDEQVTIIEKAEQGPWMRVRTLEGKEGYVSSLFLN